MEMLIFIATTYFIMLLQWAIIAVEYDNYVEETFKEFFDKN